MIHVLFSIMFLCGLILAGNSRPFNIYRLLVWTHTSTCFLFWFLTDTLLAAVSAVCGVLVGNCSKTAVYLQYRSFLLSRFKKEGEYINKKPNGISKYQNKKGDIIMFRQYRKTIIAALLCFTIILTQALPCTGMVNVIKAEAAETDTFNGASGEYAGVKWSISPDGHLVAEGEGNYSGFPGWRAYKEHIKTAEINIKNITNAMIMFAECENLTSIDFSKSDTSNVTNMMSMFNGCTSLKTINWGGFDTSNVTNMKSMFEYCTSLTSLDLSSFNTSKVKDMYSMFNDCWKLTSIDLSSFDTSNVADMYYMFQDCKSLTSLNLSSFNTSNLENMSWMFQNCNALTSINLSSFNTSKVTMMVRVFDGCKSLTSLDLSSFNTSNVTDMTGIFNDCFKLTNLNFSNLDCSKTSLSVWNCPKLTSIDLSNSINPNVLCNNLNSLEKLYLCANATNEILLPVSDGYHWIDDKGTTVTSTIKNVPRKVVYTKVDDNYIYVPSPSPEPGVSPSPSPVPTVSPSPEPLPTSAPDDDINTGIYFDSSCTSLAAISTRTHFVNGGNVKQPDNSKVNYKTKTYYTNLQASNIVTVNNKGKTKTKKGKLVAGITSTSEKPSLVKGKISKDVPASKIAKASINKGKIKVTAQKQPGVVYLWVMDTGDAGAYACAKIIIKAAPF